MERKKLESLSVQMKKKVNTSTKEDSEFKGNFDTVRSTGSTLLDLAISGNRVHGGGLPGGVFVEAFGPSQSGKTALLCEIASNVLSKNGEVQFHDPEARLDAEFGEMFGMHIKEDNYFQPNTVTEVFKNVRTWVPPINSKNKIVHGIFADSLAALSTDMEMNNDEGDPFGGRRAKEFSEQLRKTCREIKQKNYLMVCSNQIRMNIGGGTYAPKYTTPGGEAIKFYASIRLKFNNPEKIYKVVKVAGKEVKKVIGIETEIEVIKTVDSPYRKASVVIIYGYGFDNTRQNLQYIKDFTKNTTYTLGGKVLNNSMDDAIKIIEDSNAENDLREEVINLWEEIESKFVQERKPKR